MIIIEKIFVDLSPYVLSILFLIWVLRTFKHFKNLPNKKTLSVLVFASLLIFSVFKLCNVNFKILSDETNLLSVSNMIALHGKALLNTETVFKNDVLVPISNYVPTRPLLFPLLTSYLHLATGYRAENVFALNFLIGILVVMLGWALLQNTSTLFKCLFLTMMVASPPFAIFLTSGGFDVLSLLFLLLTGFFLLSFEQRPDKDNLILVVYTAICFSQIRYESLVAVVFIGVYLLVYHRELALQSLRESKLLQVTPLFFVPASIQRILTFGQFENPVGKSAFGISNFINNISDFFYSFFFNLKGPYPVIINLFGLAGLMYLAMNYKTLQKVSKLFLCYMLFLFALIVSHHLGLASLPTQVRLFLPLTVGFIFCGYVLYQKFSHSLTFKIFFYVGLIVQIGLSTYYSVKDPLTSQLTLTRETQILRKLFKENGDFSKSVFIYERPGQLTAQGYAAVGKSYLAGKDKLNSLAPYKVLLIHSTDLPPVLAEGFKTEEKFSYKINDHSKLVVSEVIRL